MGHRTGRRTVATLRRSPSAYEGFSLAATICLLVRRAASAYGDLSPRTAGRRKVATDRRSRRQTVARGEKPPYRCGGPPLLATVFPGLRRPVSGYGGPSYAEAERRSGRWGAVRLRWTGERAKKRGRDGHAPKEIYKTVAGTSWCRGDGRPAAAAEAAPGPAPPWPSSAPGTAGARRRPASRPGYRSAP